MPDMSKRKASKESDERETPWALYNIIAGKLDRPYLDVCANEANKKCAKYYGPRSPWGADGLEKPWDVPWWCNPPYSGIEAWVKKALDAPAEGVMLVPAAPETGWFRTAWSGALEVAFLAPRVRFLKDGKLMGSPPFGSAVFVFGPRLIEGPPRVGLLRWK